MLDPSELDRLVTITGVDPARLLAWENRPEGAFEITEEGGSLTLHLRDPLVVKNARVEIVGEFDTREEGDKKIHTGRALEEKDWEGRVTKREYRIAYDLTHLADDGLTPILKIYLGTASRDFQKAGYHERWAHLFEARSELEPGLKAKEVKKYAPREFPKRTPARGRGAGRGGGRGSGGRGGGGGGTAKPSGQSEGASGSSPAKRRSRRGGRGRRRGGGEGGATSGGGGSD